MSGSHSSTLDALPAGAAAVIDGVDAADATVVRLLEMGMTPSTTILITRRAPLGDPIEIAVRGTRLCLRRAQASQFRVTRLDMGTPTP